MEYIKRNSVSNSETETGECLFERERDMDKEDEVEAQQSSKAMDQQRVVDDDDDPCGFLVEQCIIPSAEENHLRSMPLFSPTPTSIPTQQQQPQPSPSPVVKHEQTDEIDIIMQTPLEIEEEEEEEEEQSVTKEPTISVDNSPPPNQNEAFSQQTRDETTSPVTGEKLQKTIEEKSPQHASSLGKSPLEQNQDLAQLQSQSQSPPTKTQTEQTHFVPPRFQPPPAAAAGVGPSSSSSSNPGNPKGGDDTTIDILDVLRSKGFYVPRPRWWRPEGYDKH